MEEEDILTSDIFVFVEYSFELEARVGEYPSFPFFFFKSSITPDTQELLNNLFQIQINIFIWL